MISLEAFMYFSAPSREQEQEWLKACRKAISAVQATYAWEIDFFAIEFHTDKYGKRISLTKNAKTEVCPQNPTDHPPFPLKITQKGE